MLYGLVLNFGGVCSNRCLRVAGVRQFQPLVDTLISKKSPCGVLPCSRDQFSRISNNCGSGCREAMATSGSVVPSGDLVVDSLVSSCGNLSGFVKPGVFFNGTSKPIRGKGRVRMKNGEARSLHSLHGSQQSNGHDRSFNDTASLLPAGLCNPRMVSSSCYSDRAAASEASPDSTSISMDQISSLAISVEEKNPRESALKLVSGAYYLPHPAKEKTGGEDAHFICHDACSIGVADGVGGWADVGIDSGKYARELMLNSVNAIRELLPGDIDLLTVLERAHARTTALGSSTACLIALKNQDLNAINLGDSGFIVIRDGHTVFQSPVQQHGFNFPYQLDRSNMGDQPNSAQVFKIPVEDGDAIVAGSDGLFDNLFSSEIEIIVAEAMKQGLSPETTAEKIAASARARALDTKNETPFSSAAQQAGYSFYGGKLDDLTVIVSYVSASQDP